MDGLHPGERGFLLLTSKLGCPNRKPLTVPQLRDLFLRSSLMERSDPSRELDARDLIAIGYSAEVAANMVGLLRETLLLEGYMKLAKKANCIPITRATDVYPAMLRNRLGMDSPGVLWAKGDTEILQFPAVSLVGSRQLLAANRAFAEAVGMEAARQGYTLVSGNARGADVFAQNACLAAGGRVISVVADSLENHNLQENILYLSENSFDEEFSAQRALSRNRVIHSLGRITLVAQCDLEKGGTWDGTVKNLQKNWSPVFCFDDGSAAAIELSRRGAKLISLSQLESFANLKADTEPFI